MSADLLATILWYLVGNANRPKFGNQFIRPPNELGN